MGNPDITNIKAAQLERGVDASGMSMQAELCANAFALAKRLYAEIECLPSLAIETVTSQGTVARAHPLIEQANSLTKTAQAGLKALGLNADSKNAARAEEDGLGKFMASLEE